MHSKPRGILFFVFIITFVVTAPVVVLYTAGYRYNFGTGQIVQTGILSLASSPKGATIYIDDVRQKEKTPSVIDNVYTGEHLIKLEKDSYTTWQKELKVERKQTTFAEQIGLFSVNDPQLIIKQEIIDFFPHPQSQQNIYIVNNDVWTELWLFDSETIDSKLLARYPIETTVIKNIKWSLKGDFVSLQTIENNQTHWSLVSTSETIVIKINDLLDNIDEGFWDAGDTDNFIVVSDKAFYSISPQLPVPKQITDTPNIALMTFDRGLILSQKANDQIAISLNKDNQTTIIAYLPQSDYIFQPAVEQVVMLEDIKNGRLILIDATGADQPILLNTSVVLWQWDFENERLLYSDGYDLHIYYVNEHRDETLTRISDPITGLAWYPLSDNILYTQNHGLYAIELDNRNGRQTITLVEGQDLEQLWVNKKGRQAYFVGTINDQSGIFEQRLQK
ncbi:PEGA domain-containing protein [Patescibacteria group bacterium]